MLTARTVLPMAATVSVLFLVGFTNDVPFDGESPEIRVE